MSYGVSVTLSFLGGYTFPQKKGIALAIAVLHFSYFFHGDGLKPRKPSRQGSSRGSPAVSLESVTLDLRKSRNVPRSVFGFQSASRERRRKGPTEREFRVAKRRRARRERAFGSADGNDRLASRRVLEPRAFPGERRTSAGTGRATASSSLHRRTMMDAWKRETRGFSPACPGVG